MRAHGTAATGGAGGDDLAAVLLGAMAPGRRDSLAPALEALLACERRRWLARAEEIWLRRFGWSLMRPLLATGAAIAILLLLWDREQAAGLLAPVVLGAAAFHVVLQVYVHRWTTLAARRGESASAERAIAIAALRRLAGEADRAG